ncbi:hypothetical protein H0E87_031517 [Populus deltoides]|uniref:Uncharacterized protein n=1 Tax=Populus deltoides TaxID=3696 RepID=A0A8T2WG91_POPDE|nr:hypothetical protein H0E87_031517 [Populus deltoides]
MACYVANETRNFELPFSWITLIQEGFQFNLIRSGTDLVLPPASKASTVPVSFNFRSFSTPKNGSGAKIGASSKSCSLVDDGPDGSGVVLLESEPLLPLFEGVFSGLALSSTCRIGVSRLSDDRVPIPCSAMKPPSICADGSETGSSPCLGTPSVLWIWRSCFCTVFWFKLMDSYPKPQQIPAGSARSGSLRFVIPVAAFATTLFVAATSSLDCSISPFLKLVGFHCYNVVLVFQLFLVRISCYCLGWGLITGVAWLELELRDFQPGLRFRFVQTCRSLLWVLQIVVDELGMLSFLKLAGLGAGLQTCVCWLGRDATGLIRLASLDRCYGSQQFGVGLLMMCGWSSHDCLVHGSVWVRLSPQLLGPHTCYCTSAAVLLCGYLILVAIVDAWDCCRFLGLQAEASLSVNGDQSGVGACWCRCCLFYGVAFSSCRFFVCQWGLVRRGSMKDWSASDAVRIVSPDCLVKGSVLGSDWVRLSPQLFGPLVCCSTRAIGLLLWIVGCSLFMLLLLLVCVAAGDDFQPGLLFCLSRPVGFLQIACAVGPLGVGLGFDAAGF